MPQNPSEAGCVSLAVSGLPHPREAGGPWLMTMICSCSKPCATAGKEGHLGFFCSALRSRLFPQPSGVVLFCNTLCVLLFWFFAKFATAVVPVLSLSQFWNSVITYKITEGRARTSLLTAQRVLVLYLWELYMANGPTASAALVPLSLCCPEH